MLIGLFSGDSMKRFISLLTFFLLTNTVTLEAFFDPWEADSDEIEERSNKLKRKREGKSAQEQSAIDDGINALEDLKSRRTDQAVDAYVNSKRKRQFIKKTKLAISIHNELSLFFNPEGEKGIESPKSVVEVKHGGNTWLDGSLLGCIPVDVFREIAFLSKNSKALSSTCRTLRKFGYKPSLTLTLPYNFFQTEQGQAMLGGWSPFPFEDRVVALNLFHLSDDDYDHRGIDNEVIEVMMRYYTSEIQNNINVNVLELHETLGKIFKNATIYPDIHPNSNQELKNLLSRISDRPDVMAMIEYILKTNICGSYGNLAFLGPFVVKNESRFSHTCLNHFCHKDTIAILKLLREYLSGLPFKREYYRESDLGRSAGRSPRRLHESRIFKGIVQALSSFAQDDQLCLLRRLLRVTAPDHIDEATLKDDTGLSPDMAEVFKVGLVRIHKQFGDKTDLEFDKYVAELHKTNSAENPLIRSRIEVMREAVISWIWGSKWL